MKACAPVTTVVIVAYNSKSIIGETIHALHEAAQAGDIECVVVDNASIDGTADFINAHFPWVHLIRSPHNLGYGRGCNLGLLAARTRYSLILNPDALIPHDALQILVNFMTANRQAGIVAPAIIEDAKHFQTAGLMTTPASLLKAAFGCSQTMPHCKPIIPGGPAFRTSWVCGAIMLVRTDLFQNLGGFDPRFFLYFEETDLCRRAIKAGAEIWAVGKAVASHVGGASAKATGQTLHSACIANHYYHSRFYYLFKHFGALQAIGTECLLLVLSYIRCIKQLLAGNKDYFLNNARRPFLSLPARPGRD